MKLLHPVRRKEDLMLLKRCAILVETLQAQTEQLFAAGDAQRAEETAQLWGILCGVLDQFVEILGDTTLDAEEFASLMRLIP